MQRGWHPSSRVCISGAASGTLRGMSESVKAESTNGSIEFLGSGVVIKTKGGSKTIPLTAVQGAEFKKAGMTAGYIRLSVAGSADVGLRTKMKNEALAKDPNAVLFSRSSKNAEFEAVADAINQALLG